MKILLVNNNTQHYKALEVALAGHETEVQIYKPGIKFNDAGKDLIILSGGGGEGLEINDKFKAGKLWYEDQMEFVLRSTQPLLGICMGFEVIARAYGSKVEEMDKLVQGFLRFDTTAKGQSFLNRQKLKQWEAHQWRVGQVSGKEFDILATSASGIEVIRHKKKRIFATQFHPEIAGGTLKLKELLSSFSA